MPEEKEDLINHPKHYQCLNPIKVPEERLNGDQTTVFIEALDVIKAWNLHENHYLATVLAYILRSDHKGSMLQDLEKARFYLDEEITRLKVSDIKAKVKVERY